MITVSSAASSRALLTTAEGKTALNLSGSSYDTAVDNLILRVSDMIAMECAVPSDGVAVPTLLQETIVETVRLDIGPEYLVLSRRPVSSITSIVEAGVSLTVATDVDLEVATGIVHRLEADGERSYFDRGKIVITYVAGYPAAPAGLKIAAETILREQWAAASRDPLLRSISVEGIDSRTYWTGGLDPSNGVSISSQALAMLAPYRYYPV